MADAMDTLKNILGDDAEDKIKNVMSSFSGGDSGGGGFDNDSMEVAQIREMINQLGSSRNDPRSNLLMSLKPYMRETRQRSIDSAVKLLNLTKLSQLFRM